MMTVALMAVAQPRTPCSQSCFDAMIAVNYANFSTLGAQGDSDCFSLVVSDRSVSGVRCSYIYYELSLSTVSGLSHNFTASATDFAPLIDAPSASSCKAPRRSYGPQYTTSCGLGTPTSVALNIFMQRSEDIGAGASHTHVQTA